MYRIISRIIYLKEESWAIYLPVSVPYCMKIALRSLTSPDVWAGQALPVSEKALSQKSERWEDFSFDGFLSVK